MREEQGKLDAESEGLRRLGQSLTDYRAALSGLRDDRAEII